MTLTYKIAPLTLNLYDRYAPDFFNTAYADIEYKGDLYTLSAQGIMQNSIGNPCRYISYKESSLALVYRNKFSDSDSYDSIISQWDWTL